MPIRVSAFVCALLVLVGVKVHPAPAAPRLAVRSAARAFRPGELAVLTIAGREPFDRVRVTVFDRTVDAFAVQGGRWEALVGIDLDQRPGRYDLHVEATIGGDIARESLSWTVQPKAFPVRRLRVDPEFVNPSPDLLERIRRESAFTRERYAASAPVRLWSGSFVRPVPDRANSRFGTRSVFNGERRSPHAGADFLSPAGTPVGSPNAGQIVCARELFFTGNTIIIDHGLGLFSMLAHLSRLDVEEGESVTAGQPLGLVGATGRVTGPHLHWALTVSGARVDPLSVLALLGK